jgi:tetratricopeptide (TPR) repeat protein
MKKCIYGFVFTLALSGPLFAQIIQLNSGTGLPSITESVEIKDYYYHIISDGGSADASAIIRELELRFNAYNQLFRFDLSRLNSPLKVRIFKTKEAYDAYVSARLGRTRAGAVYLHYSQTDRRELVIHQGSPEEPQMIAHQAFLQYLRGFIANPPAWIREGFAIYFATLVYDRSSGKLGYEENLAWLDTVKNLGAALPSLESILLADTRGVPENFQPAAWSLVSFFLNNGNEDYFRSLTEMFMALSSTASAQENAEIALRRITVWNDLDTLRRDYAAYISSRKTFAELIQEGQKAYNEKDYISAELSFLNAREQKPTHYASYYYLGLLAYEDKNYDMADGYYRSALQFGADPALVRYALGINAASAGRDADAIAYLEDAAAASPERYKDRVDDILRQIR